ncbi:hypothetical protein PCANC_06684 [Puccinia coronata f. sp. avenae]|uniref:Uncharacterized protein n=1 Tax=Puccinia coronata f. sp. avenae TaxID=200324 RepID=A0A2N5VUB9_9BASI|nr:hypothetical protein PCANC_06684 [Puccinia coronata f. sp. avenae]
MYQHDNPMLSEFDHLLAVPSSSTVDASSLDSTSRGDFTSPSFPLDLWGTLNENPQSTFSAPLVDPMTTLTGLGVEYPNTGFQTGLSQDNLAVFDSLFRSQENNELPPQAPPPKPESSCNTTASSSRPRFAPPKGPRKQHRTGFRQLPGANGVVKKGRPSKNEYKLAGVEVDMYALKGVTLNGPIKSLAEVKGGEFIAKRPRRSSRQSSRKSKRSMSGALQADTLSRPSIPSIPEEPLLLQAPEMSRQSYKSTQDMLFSATQPASTNNSYPLEETNQGLPTVAPQDFLSAFQALDDQISSQLYRDSHQLPQKSYATSQSQQNLAPPQFQQSFAPSQLQQSFAPSQLQQSFAPSQSQQSFQSSSQCGPDLVSHLGFEPVSGYLQSSSQFQPMADFPALNPPEPLNRLPWETDNGSHTYLNPVFGLDAAPLLSNHDQAVPGNSYNSTVYDESSYNPALFQNFSH